MTTQITITRPDDWHLHLRDGAALAAVVAHSARQFGRAIVMPNLRPPVTTTAQALAYRARIVATLPPGSSFDPAVHGHWSRQVGPDPLVTLFVRG